MEVTATIKINIENARKVLMLSAGSLQEMEIYKKMSNNEIVDKVISRFKCYGVEKGE